VKRIFLLLLCIAATIGFTALGVWQIERRAWKLDLIARVEARLHAPPVAPPPAQRWSAVTALGDEYRRLRLRGHFLHDRTTLVDALTERGAGFWVLTPLVTQDGVILVNRGFVPSDQKRGFACPQGDVKLTGLLRMPEVGGRFLRPNGPKADLWYSRDVQAIAKRRGLGSVAPFFVDADATTNTAYPVGGLTVVRFRNEHLIYALTWLALACLAAVGAGLVLLTSRRS
jgi:surfeit locus 1 family protein